MYSNKKVGIEEIEEEELFAWFCKHQNIWKEAQKLRPGSLVLHFDKDWKIRKVEYHQYENVSDIITYPRIDLGA